MTSFSSQERVVQQIISTHSPDANFKVDEKALLSMAKDILCQAISKLDEVLMAKDILCQDISKLDQDLKIDSKVSEDKSHQQVITEELAFTILGIGCELSCNCSGGGGMKSITLAVFDRLVKYSWKNKLVIALLAFAIKYGELCLLWKVDANNPLTKYVDQLKLLLEICEQETFISRQETLISGLLGVIMRVTMTVIEPNSYDKTPFSENQISTAVYWAVKGIVACSSQSIGLVNLQYMVSNTEAQKKLTELSRALETIQEDLRHTMTVFIKEREMKKNEEGYIKIKNLIEKSTHKTDNEKIFTELIQTQDDKPLFNGVTSKKESLKVLKSKRVILFISNLDILDEDISEIAQRVSTSVRPYEIVWFPIVDMPNTKKEVIEEKTRLAKWRSLHYSVTLPPYVIQYIKKDWHFEKKPVMVVFNAHGKVVNSNAYHMIMIWGKTAYPFFANCGEETLWRNSKWNFEFLMDGVASDEQWLKEGKLACLFECDDYEWIRNFVSTMEKERIRLIYVGKKHRDRIRNELPCVCWDEWWDDHKIRRFWARMDSMLYSKMKSGTSIDEDKTFKDVMMLLGCSGSGEGWTVIGQGSNSIVASNGKTTMKCIDTMKTDGIKEITYENYFTKHHELISQVDVEGKTHGNYNIHIACTSDIIREKMVCVDCHCPMAKRVTYSCSGKKE